SVHSNVLIHRLGSRISAIDIKSNASDLCVLLSHFLEVGIEAFVDPLLSKCRFDVHTLYPPHHAVAPIAPLVSDERATHNAAHLFRHVVASTRSILKYSPHSLE